MPNTDIHHAVLLERLDNLNRLLEKLDTKVDTLETKVEAIEKQANFWKGGLMVILAFGGLVTWLSDLWSKVIK